MNSPTLLPDDPAIEDTFGVHQRIAGAIASLIRDNKGGKSIAIEGSWGSGKSTVVLLLSKQVSLNEPDTVFFVYDAWRHEGDPLRRAFLQAFVEKLLTRKNWLKSQKKWRRRLKTLSGKYNRQTKKATSLLSSASKFFTATICLVPLGLSLINEGYKSCEPLVAGRILPFCPSPLLPLGLFVVLLPLLVACTASWYSRKFKGDGLAMFMNKTPLSETTISIGTGDQTSIEFQKTFEKALEEALVTNDPRGVRKVVLVIDNLDRLDAKERQDVWALLRSFVDAPDSREKRWAKRVWVIVPVAPNAVAVPLASASIDSPAPRSSTANDQKPSLGSEYDAFLGKVFQARFVLPDPMLDQWQEHLRELLTRAFSGPVLRANGTEGLIVELCSIYRGASAPTPRWLLLFVNQLVSLAVQWEWDDYPLPLLAAYALEADQGNILGRLRDNKVPLAAARHLLGGAPNLEDKFASLYFNTGEREALEILQGKRIQGLLESGLNEPLWHMLLRRPSFAAVVSNVVNDRCVAWTQSGGDRFFYVICAIFRENLGAGSDDGRIKHLLSSTRVLVESKLADIPLPLLHLDEFMPALFALLDGTQSEKLPSEILKLMRRIADAKADGTSARVPGDHDLTAWNKRLLSILSHPKILPLLEGEKRDFYLPIDVAKFHATVEICLRRRLNGLLPLLLPISGEAGVSSYLAERAKGSGVPGMDVALVGWLALKGNTEGSTATIAKVLKPLAGTEPMVKWEAFALSHFYLKLAAAIPALKDLVDKSIENGHLYFQIGHAIERQDFDSAGALAAVALFAAPEVPPAGYPTLENWNIGRMEVSRLVSTPNSTFNLLNKTRDCIVESLTVGEWWKLASVNDGLSALTESMAADVGFIVQLLESNVHPSGSFPMAFLEASLPTQFSDYSSWWLYVERVRNGLHKPADMSSSDQ